MQRTNTHQTLITEKQNMATHRLPLLSEEFTYISDAKKFPLSGLWKKVLDNMNSFFSMILVLSYQNKYRLMRVKNLQKLFCGNRPVLHAHKAEFQILHLTFKALFPSPFFTSLLNSALVSCPSFPSWVFAFHLCFLSPAHTLHSLTNQISPCME